MSKIKNIFKINILFCPIIKINENNKIKTKCIYTSISKIYIYSYSFCL